MEGNGTTRFYCAECSHSAALDHWYGEGTLTCPKCGARAAWMFHPENRPETKRDKGPLAKGTITATLSKR
jgi:DNA-directed RNA polymerase subunit RPC12/RpoP